MTKTKRQSLGLLLGAAALLGILVWVLVVRAGDSNRDGASSAAQNGGRTSGSRSGGRSHHKSSDQREGDKGKAEEPRELTEEERFKEIDGKNLKLIHKGILAYMKKHGHYPDYLSELVPDFVNAEALISPRGGLDRSEHADPGLEKPSYGYEFSNLEFVDGRTFAEIKDTQRAEWGDAIPMLRSFGYSGGKVLNMSFGGILYETQINWEWDPATLDVVEKHGWGPGLDAGEITEVRVTNASGNAIEGAQVWADGRRFSFSLPNRPFSTNAQGIARIPLGMDADRTALVLRVEGNGIASPVQRFATGQSPSEHEIVVGESTTIGGRVVDGSGDPIAETWVYLNRTAPGLDGGADDGGVATFTGSDASLGVVRTDARGRWSAQLHPDDASLIRVVVPSVNGIANFSSGQQLDAEAASRSEAVIVIGSDPNAEPSE